MRASLAAAAAGAMVTVASAGWAASFPAPTEEMLKSRNLSPEILKGLDEELAVPAAWIDGAKKDGKLVVRMVNPERQMDGVLRVFKGRYPFLEVEYSRVAGRDIMVGPLIAYKAGTYVSDVISEYNGVEHEWLEIGGLEDLRSLPAWRNVPDSYKHAAGISLGWRIQFWCLAYHTEKVKEAELPHGWDDLPANARWRGGQVGMASRPHMWLNSIAASVGERWLAPYTNRIFAELRPQLRKEASSGLTRLIALGEFDLAVPISNTMVDNERARGAPIGFHCPEPVPVEAAPIGIMKGGPRANAARLFVNWMGSKEGQLANNTYLGAISTHKDMGRPEFLGAAANVAGKKLAPKNDVAQSLTPALMTEWRRQWVGGGGAAQAAD